jgi:glycosyltransferase involved in cell wall biosynthesis
MPINHAGTSRLPTISIVTPSYNQGEFLEECIDSILSQNYPNLEYIIMDGGSSDNSVEIIKKYEKYLTYWQSRPDGGQYAAVNEGFTKTSGEIMAWLNSDDKYQENAFFKVATLFARYPHISWLTARHAFWDGAGRVKMIEASCLPIYSRGQYLRKEYDRPYIQQESTFWRRSLWEKAGGYLRSDLKLAGDLELWTRFFRYAQLYTVDTLLGGYRVHGNQKAVLQRALYQEEAERILDEEQALFAEDHNYNPPAPESIKFDVAEFIAFMKSFDDELVGGFRSFTAEQVIDYLVHNPVGMSTEAIAELEALRSSRSWRVTRPLRWLGEKMQILGLRNG